MEELSKIEELFASYKADATKSLFSGNKAAGRRARKVGIEISKRIQGMRQRMMDAEDKI